MKRFLLIFGICFGSFVAFMGGYLGIRYLIGDFNEKPIPPAEIRFDTEDGEYTFYKGGNNTITITATNDDVTQKKISLFLGQPEKNVYRSKEGSNLPVPRTYEKDYWTDEVIIIPKIVTIGEPFEVGLYTDNSYAHEVTDGSLDDYIVGGVSKIIAQAEGLATVIETKVYVDVPVAKTELVIFNKEATNLTDDDVFNNLESSAFVSSLTEDNITNINAGETFYVGLKFYPSASAIKYSKVKYTNVLFELKNEIQKLYQTGQLIQENESFYKEISDLLEETQADVPQTIMFGQIMSIYEKIMACAQNESVATSIQEIVDNYYKNLKYYNLTENPDSTQPEERRYKTIDMGRVPGTNLYKLKATQNLGNAKFYTYNFEKANYEDMAFALMQDGEDVLDMLEREVGKQTAMKNTPTINIIDVEVNAIGVKGSVSNIFTTTPHTIFASMNGENNQDESYLKIELSNTDVPDVNLQNRMGNVAIRFEKESIHGQIWEVADYIAVEGSQKISIDGKDWYLPIGEAKYWKVYASEGVVGKFRICISYVTNNGESYVESVSVPELLLPNFELEDVNIANEKLVTWKDSSNKELKVINIEGALDKNGIKTDITDVESLNLEQLVDDDSVKQNAYKTIRYLLYAPNMEEGDSLTNYFDCKEGVEYTQAGFDNKVLYELNSSILSLKTSELIVTPNFDVYVIFVTLKTDINGEPIKLEGTNQYSVVRYSAVEGGHNGTLSSIKVSFSESLSTLSGEFRAKNTDMADIVTTIEENDLGEPVEVSRFKVADNCENVLMAVIQSTDGIEKLLQAVSNNEVSIVAKTSLLDPNNYITVKDTTQQGALAVTFDVSTLDLESDLELSLYIAYTLKNATYLFPIKCIEEGADEDLNTITIVANTQGSASFNFADNEGARIKDEEIKEIRVETKVDGSRLVQVFTVVYKDSAKEPLTLNDSTQVMNSGILNIVVTNFLGKDGGADWRVVSSNESIISVEEEQLLSLKANGEAEISLYLRSGQTLQSKVKFVINNEGSVSKYRINDYQRPAVEYTTYNGASILIEVEGSDNRTIHLKNDQEEASELFSMWYRVGSDEIKLSFTVALADDDSLAVYNAITGGNKEDYVLVTQQDLSRFFELDKDIGSEVSVRLIYTCCEIPSLTQKISLNFSKTVRVTSLEVKDPCDNSIITPNNGKYEVYAGHEYNFATTLENAGGNNAYYFIEITDGGVKKLEKINESPLANVNHKFDDVARNTDIILYVSNIDLSDPTKNIIGDLKHEIRVTVKPNVKISEKFINEYTVELSDDGSASLLLSKQDNGDENFIFERIKAGSEKLVFSEFNYSNNNNIVIDGNNLKFQYGRGVGAVQNIKNEKIEISYAGLTLNKISINIIPKNLEKEETTRITYYNGEKTIIIAVGDDATANIPSIIMEQFDNAVDRISISNDNLQTWVSKSSPKTVLADIQSKTLFKDIDSYIVITDNVGNTTRYKLLICQNAFPFVTFYSEDTNDVSATPISYKTLDIYDLFGPVTNSQLKDYYLLKGIQSLNTIIYGGDEIELNEIIDVQRPGVNIIYSVSLVDGGNVDTVAKIEAQKLITKSIGGDTYIKLTLSYYNFNIPVLVKVNESQKLQINYLYDDRSFTTLTQSQAEESYDFYGYGSDEYDNTHMMAEITEFGNAPMEYVSFDINGYALIENFNLNRFALLKYSDDEAKYVEDVTYNGGYIFDVVKVYTNLDGMWAETNSINSFVDILGNTIRIASNGNRAVRVKVLVEAIEGGAIGYYYIHAQTGYLVSLQLNKKVGTDESIVYGADTITAQKDAVISFEQNNGSAVAYYLEQNYILSYKVVSGKNFCNSRNNNITIGLAPNGGIIVVELYTVYGKLADITINVVPYYTASLDEIELISGTVKKFSDVIKIVAGGEINVETVEIADNQTTEFDKYIINLEDDGKTIKTITFKHSAQDYTIENFVCMVVIAGEIFSIDIDTPITVKASVVAKAGSGIKTEYIEQSGVINIEADEWKKIFDGIDNSELLGLKYELVLKSSGVETVYSAKDENRGKALFIGHTITTEKEYQLIYNVYGANGDEDILIATNTITIKIKPQYTAQINYPKANQYSSFTEEYVQVGGSIDLKTENFNGVQRIVVMQTENPSTIVNEYDIHLISAPEGVNNKQISEIYTFDIAGTYIFSIKIGDATYGTYRVVAIKDNPFTINDSNLSGKSFYAGYGSEQILNYVDIELDIPAGSGIPIEQVFNVGCFDVSLQGGKNSYTSNGVVLAENRIFYDFGNANRWRFVCSIVNTKKINANNIYVYYSIGEGDSKQDIYIKCENVTITPRYILSYNGEEINTEFYENVINTDASSTPVGDGGNIEHYVEFKYEIINVSDKAENLYFDIVPNIEFTKNSDASDVVVLNANEIEEGVSFVKTFGVQDYLGKGFTKNDVAKINKDSNSVVEIELEYVKEDKGWTYDETTKLWKRTNGFSNALRFESDKISVGGKEYAYDFMIKALGADNDGTIVTLRFTYKVNTKILFSKDLTIKVNSDIEYSMLNNDTTSTPNSQSHQLVLKNTGTYKLIDPTVTTLNGVNQYIYVSGKYKPENEKNNLAGSMKITPSAEIGNGSNWATFENNELKFNKQPTFGDKYATLVLTNDYGFTLTYYITLVAGTRILGVETIGREEYFEGDSLSVYTRTDSSSLEDGLAVNLSNDSKTIKIESVKVDAEDLKALGVSQDDLLASEGNTISFEYLGSNIWNKGNGQSITITLLISIYDGIDNSETYVIEKRFVIKKQFELRLDEENTYVRDGVDFDIAHLVSVYDYKLQTYLGEPKLEKAEALELSLTFNKGYIIDNVISETTPGVNDGQKYEITYNNSKYIGKCNINKVSIESLIGFITGGVLPEKVTFTTTQGTAETPDIQRKIVSYVLKEYYGVQYLSGKISVDFRVNAKNNNGSGNDFEGYTRVEFDGMDSEGSVHYIYLGEHDRIFSNQTVNTQEFSFEFNLINGEKFASYQGGNASGESNKILGIKNESSGAGANAKTEYYIEEKNIYILDVAVWDGISHDDPVYIWLEIEGDGIEIASNSGDGESTKYKYIAFKLSQKFNIIHLSQAELLGKNIKLFTQNVADENKLNEQACYWNDAENVKRFEKVEARNTTVINKGIYFNGLSSNDVARARNLNIENLHVVDKDNNEIKCSNLDVNGSFAYIESENGNIYYQEVDNKIQYSFITHGTEREAIIENVTKKLRTTLYYTGVDTSKAYVVTDKLHYVTITKNDDETYNNTYEIDSWGNKFELIPGIGRTSQIAVNEDVSFVNNKNMLEFSLRAISNSGSGDVGSSGLVTISKDGKVVLSSEYMERVNSYYITIDVFCKYPKNSINAEVTESQTENTEATDSLLIGTIYIAFKEPVNN